MYFMNSSVSKIVTRIILVCYIAVASIAAAHAFPKAIGDELNTMSSSSTSLQVNSDCHQSTESDSATSSVSACKVFCAAMGNVVINHLTSVAATRPSSLSIVFSGLGVTDSDLSLEPHPPK